VLTATTKIAEVISGKEISLNREAIRLTMYQLGFMQQMLQD